MNEDDISVGVIGYGPAGRIIHVPLITNTPGLRLAAVSSLNVADITRDLPNTPAFADAEELIASPDIDLVVVASPNDTHARWTEAAIAAGKHVIVEKPFALTVEEARRMLTSAEGRSAQIFVFQNRRFDSDYLTIKQVIESGALGEITLVESAIERYNPEAQAAWAAPVPNGSGVWYDVGPHLVDQAVQLFGLPDSVNANFARLRPGEGAEDWAEVTLSYDHLRVILKLNLLAAGHHRRFRVHGRQASAMKHGQDVQGRQYLAGMPPGAPSWGDDADPVIVVAPSGEEQIVRTLPGDHRRMYMQIADAIRGRGPNPTPASSILDTMAVLEAGARSAQEARTIGLNSLR